MSLPTFDSARDEILGLFNAYWEVQTPLINDGSPIQVYWQGVDSDNPPPSNQAYSVPVVRHGPSRQVTFGKVGERRYERSGLITIQVFSPLSVGGGLSFAEKAAIIARDAFEGEGTASGIWFRNVRIVEVGPSKSWYQMNVIVEFVYDEMK